MFLAQFFGFGTTANWRWGFNKEETCQPNLAGDSNPVEARHSVDLNLVCSAVRPVWKKFLDEILTKNKILLLGTVTTVKFKIWSWSWCVCFFGSVILGDYLRSSSLSWSLVMVIIMVMVCKLTSNIEGDGVADAVPLKVVGDAGVDPGLLPLHPLQHKALVRHDQTRAHICYQGAALHMEIQ